MAPSYQDFVKTATPDSIDPAKACIAMFHADANASPPARAFFLILGDESITIGKDQPL